jgi:phage terminase small subunit
MRSTEMSSRKSAEYRRRRFAAEYIKDLNATRAAAAAGYSTKTAYSQGQRLLKDVRCAEEIRTRLEQQIKAGDITAKQVLKQIHNISVASLDRFLIISEDGVPLINFGALRDGDLDAIQEFTQEEYTEGVGDRGRQIKKTKIKLHNKLDALGKLLTYLEKAGMLVGQAQPETITDVEAMTQVRDFLVHARSCGDNLDGVIGWLNEKLAEAT